MNTYWRKRQQEQLDLLFDKTEADFNKQMAKEYKRCLIETRQQLVELYQEIQASSQNGTLLVSDLYKYDRYYKLVNQLASELNKVGMKENFYLDKSLTNMYIKTNELIGSSIGFNTGFQAEQLKTVLNTIWCADGRHWSNRIWVNKALLQEHIEKGLVNSIVRGATREDLVKDITSSMNVGFNQANRLVRTELSYVQNRACVDKYKEAGIEKYTILAESDACDLCKDLAEQEFSVDELVLPVHPNCRCSAIAII